MARCPYYKIITNAVHYFASHTEYEYIADGITNCPAHAGEKMLQ